MGAGAGGEAMKATAMLLLLNAILWGAAWIDLQHEGRVLSALVQVKDDVVTWVEK